MLLNIWGSLYLPSVMIQLAKPCGIKEKESDCLQ